MLDETFDVENAEDVLYGYHNDNGVLLWTPNVMFAQAQAHTYGTFKIYVEKI